MKCVASCCMVAIIIVSEDMYLRDSLVITYFAITLTSVLGTVHIIGLAHIHMALTCEEIPDEETVVNHTWYYMTSEIGFIIYCVKCILRLDYFSVECVIGVLSLAITSGNVLLLSRLFKLVGKCSVSFMFCVNVLGILCDVLLIFYGFLLAKGDYAGLFNNIVKVTFTCVMAMQTVLLLCSKDTMDWKKFSKTSDEVLEM